MRQAAGRLGADGWPGFEGIVTSAAPRDVLVAAAVANGREAQLFLYHFVDGLAACAGIERGSRLAVIAPAEHRTALEKLIARAGASVVVAVDPP